MFLGEYQHSVDEKGRLVMPSKFRPRLADGLVVTKGREGCLFVFPAKQWEDEYTYLMDLPGDERATRERLRVVVGSADQQRPDKQGRIQLSVPLRTYAGIDKEVSIIGVGNRLEIWDSEAWRVESEKADKAYAGVGPPAGGEGI